MRPRTRRNHFLLKTAGTGLVIVCLSLGASLVVSAQTVSSVVIRDSVSRAHRDELTSKLRKITGWKELRFESDGALYIDSEEPIGGSGSARALLTKAVAGENVIVIEDASSRSDVAFCRLVPGKWIRGDEAPRPAVYVVLIDFTDFEQIIGDVAARESFHVGWGLLHELDHVLMDSEDSEVDGQVGECEDHINRMREEVGLPLRANYFFTPSSLKTDPNFNKKFVRLPFEQRDTFSARTKRYWLMWDSTAVGGLPTGNQAASLRYPATSLK